MSDFGPEPTDRLQAIADVGLAAILQRFPDEDDVTVVISIESDGEAATALSIPDGGDERSVMDEAFQVQLRHTLMSARRLGYDLRVI